MNYWYFNALFNKRRYFLDDFQHFSVVCRTELVAGFNLHDKISNDLL